MVDVEVDDGHALQAAHVERVARGDGHVVVEAEAHRGLARGVVAGRADRAESVLGAAVQHEVGGRDRGAGGAQRGLAGEAAGGGVGVDRDELAALGHLGEGLVEFAEVVARVRVGQVLLPREGRVVVAHQHVGQAGGEEVVLDGGQAGGTFRMAGAHVVPAAVGVAEERGRHGRPACLESLVCMSFARSPARRPLFGYRCCHDLIVASASDKAEEPD